MFVWRNKLPQLACTKFTSQASQWNGTGRDKNEHSRSHEPFGQDAAMLRFLIQEENGNSTVDRLHGVQYGNQPAASCLETEQLQRCMTTDNLTSFLDEGKEKVQIMSTGDYWNEASKIPKGFPRIKRRNSSMTNISLVPDIIPLDVLFSICSENHGWLKIQDKKVTFLHASDSSTCDKSVKFVVGCYLAYLGDTDSDKSPITNQTLSHSHWKVNNKAFIAPQHPGDQLAQIMYSVGMDTNQIGNYGGPAQKRFAQYFLSILYSSNPPPSQSTALRIDRVVVSGLDRIRRNLRVNRVLSQKWRDQVLHPVLVVYQKGQLKWKKIVPVKDSVVDFPPGVDVAGDVVVGIWFVKDCVSTNEPPVVAFSFHSAFMEAGVVQLSSSDLSLLNIDITGLIDGPSATIAMKLYLSQSPVCSEEIEQWTPEKDLRPFDESWLAGRGGLPEIYATVKQTQTKQALNEKATNHDEEVASKVTVMPESDKKTEITPSSPRTQSSQQSVSAISSRTLSEEPKMKVTSPFLKVQGPKAPPPPPPKRKPRQHKRISSVSSTNRNREISRTKPLYWSITPKQSGTVWSELKHQDSVGESRLSLLEDLFCKDDNSKQKTVDADTAPSKSPKVKGTAVAVSVGRANNVSIMMTRFKRFEGDLNQLCKAILTGIDVETEELILLSQIGPTEGEAKDLKQHDKEVLSVPEQIMLDMTIVPRLRVKAKCQVAIRTWVDHYSRAINMLETVMAACSEIKESKRLRRTFAAILSVGNTMNRGTSRGNAGGLKIESLSKLWDTRVSKNANSSKAISKPKLQRAGSVPTAISQCLERHEVEEKISTLLDFTAVLVHDADVAQGVGHCPDYLLMELKSLSDAVNYLEDGFGEFLAEIDIGFKLLEQEFRDMTGTPWTEIDSSQPESVHELKIKNCDTILEEQREFLQSTFNFLLRAGGERSFLKQEVNVTEQHLKSTVYWLGEENVGNPKTHLRQLLMFAQNFDKSYRKLRS